MRTKRTLTLAATLVALSSLGISRVMRQVQARVAAPPAVALPTAGAVANSTKLPPGVYTTTITEADVPPPLPPEIVAGQWQIEFTEAGSFIVSKDGDIAVIGRYKSNPSRVVLTDLQGAYSCTDVPGTATGVYGWSLVNNELVLSAVQDRCAGRPEVLTAHPLQKQ